MRIDRRILPGTTFDSTGSKAVIHANQDSANARGTSAVDLQSIRSASTQVASGTAAFMGSGQNNTCSGTSSGVVCGDSNVNSGTNSLIGCGQSNLLSASGGGCFLGTGAFNSVIGAGALNALITGFLSGIGSSTLGCGIITGNQVSITSGSYNAIVTGQSSTVAGTQSAMIAASGCAISGTSAVVGGGFNHTITGDLATILNGSGNSITSGTSNYGNQILNGGGNSIGSGRQFCTVLNGYQSSTTQDWSTVLHGNGVSTFTPYEIAFGGVRQDSTNGTVQSGFVMMSMDTSDDSITQMSLDGTTASSTNQINIPVDTTWVFDLSLVAMEQRTLGSDFATWYVRGIIQNLNGTTAIVGSTNDIAKNTGSASSAPPTGWGYSISADDTNDQLNVFVQNSGTDTNIRWVARLDYTQVRYT